MTQLTGAGFTRTRLDERLATLQAAMRGIFGQDIDLDPDTIDGQTLGIFAESISNIDQLAEDVYHSFNPNSATSRALSRLVMLNGIKRIEGTYSVVDVLCVGQYGTVIPAGSLIRSTSTRAQFKTLTPVTIPAEGQIVVGCQAVVKGAQIGPANTITKIDTPIYGWQTVNNPLAATVGRAEETDEQLRLRRARSTSTPAQSIIDSMYGAIANIPEVVQCEVWDNPTGSIDANGLPPHSINAVVEGGLTADIAAQIYARKSMGAQLVGAVTSTVNDSRGNPHVIRFDRPVDVPIYVVLNVLAMPGWPTDGADRLKTQLLTWTLANQRIGKPVIHSRLYDTLNTVPAHSITTMFLGTAAAPTLEDDVPIAFNALPRFDAARITVNVTGP